MQRSGWRRHLCRRIAQAQAQARGGTACYRAVVVGRPRAKLGRGVQRQRHRFFAFCWRRCDRSELADGAAWHKSVSLLFTIVSLSVGVAAEQDCRTALEGQKSRLVDNSLISWVERGTQEGGRSRQQGNPNDAPLISSGQWTDAQGRAAGRALADGREVIEASEQGLTAGFRGCWWLTGEVR